MSRSSWSCKHLDCILYGLRFRKWVPARDCASGQRSRTRPMAVLKDVWAQQQPYIWSKAIHSRHSLIGRTLRWRDISFLWAWSTHHSHYRQALCGNTQVRQCHQWWWQRKSRLASSVERPPGPKMLHLIPKQWLPRITWRILYRSTRAKRAAFPSLPSS